MAKKQKKREAVAMEEAIAAGMVRVKGSGKKKQAEKRAGLDKGLLEDGGAFRGGVLKVAKSGSGGGGGGGAPPGGGRAPGGERCCVRTVRANKVGVNGAPKSNSNTRGP
jgi:hypothetical protein